MAAASLRRDGGRQAQRALRHTPALSLSVPTCALQYLCMHRDSEWTLNSGTGAGELLHRPLVPGGTLYLTKCALDLWTAQ